MSLRSTIHASILADPAAVAILGAAANCRHYPVRAPQGTATPYLVSQVIYGQAQETHGQPDDGEDTLDETLVQFTAIADTPAAGNALIAAVRALFIDPAGHPEAAAVLAAAHVVVGSPEVREGTEDQVDQLAPQIDLTFYHNPST